MKFYLSLIITSLSLAIAQIFLKTAATEVRIETGNFSKSLIIILRSVPVWLAIACYGVSFVAYAVLLSEREVSRMVPIVFGTQYVVLSIFAYILLDESITLEKVAGASLILSGIFLLLRG